MNNDRYKKDQLLFSLNNAQLLLILKELNKELKKYKDNSSNAQLVNTIVNKYPDSKMTIIDLSNDTFSKYDELLDSDKDTVLSIFNNYNINTAIEAVNSLLSEEDQDLIINTDGTSNNDNSWSYVNSLDLEQSKKLYEKVLSSESGDYPTFTALFDYSDDFEPSDPEDCDPGILSKPITFTDLHYTDEFMDTRALCQSSDYSGIDTPAKEALVHNEYLTDQIAKWLKTQNSGAFTVNIKTPNKDLSVNPNRADNSGSLDGEVTGYISKNLERLDVVVSGSQTREGCDWPGVANVGLGHFNLRVKELFGKKTWEGLLRGSLDVAPTGSGMSLPIRLDSLGVDGVLRSRQTYLNPDDAQFRNEVSDLLLSYGAPKLIKVHEDKNLSRYRIQFNTGGVTDISPFIYSNKWPGEYKISAIPYFSVTSDEPYGEGSGVHLFHSNKGEDKFTTTNVIIGGATDSYVYFLDKKVEDGGVVVEAHEFPDLYDPDAKFPASVFWNFAALSCNQQSVRTTGLMYCGQKIPVVTGLIPTGNMTVVETGDRPQSMDDIWPGLILNSTNTASWNQLSRTNIEMRMHVVRGRFTRLLSKWLEKRDYISSGGPSFNKPADEITTTRHCFEILGSEDSDCIRQYLLEISNLWVNDDSGHASFKLVFDTKRDNDTIISVINLTDIDASRGTRDASSGFTGCSQGFSALAAHPSLGVSPALIPSTCYVTHPGQLFLGSRKHLACLDDVSPFYAGMLVEGSYIQYGTQVSEVIYDETTYPNPLVDYYNAGIKVPGQVYLDRGVVGHPDETDPSLSLVPFLRMVTFVDTSGIREGSGHEILGSNSFESFCTLRCTRPNWTNAWLLMTGGVDPINSAYPLPFRKGGPQYIKQFFGNYGAGGDPAGNTLLLDQMPFLIPVTNEVREAAGNFFKSLFPGNAGTYPYALEQNTMDGHWYYNKLTRFDTDARFANYSIKPSMAADHLVRRGNDSAAAKLFGNWYTEDKDTSSLSNYSDIMHMSPYGPLFVDYPYERRYWRFLTTESGESGVAKGIDDQWAHGQFPGFKHLFNQIETDTCPGYYNGRNGYAQILITVSGKSFTDDEGVFHHCFHATDSGSPGGGAVLNSELFTISPQATIFLDNRHINFIRPTGTGAEHSVNRNHGPSDTNYQIANVTNSLDEWLDPSYGPSGLVITCCMENIRPGAIEGVTSQQIDPCVGPQLVGDRNYVRQENVNPDYDPLLSDPFYKDKKAPGPYCSNTGDHKIYQFGSGLALEHVPVNSPDFKCGDDFYYCCENCMCSSHSSADGVLGVENGLVVDVSGAPDHVAAAPFGALLGKLGMPASPSSENFYMITENLGTCGWGDLGVEHYFFQSSNRGFLMVPGYDGGVKNCCDYPLSTSCPKVRFDAAGSFAACYKTEQAAYCPCLDEDDYDAEFGEGSYQDICIDRISDFEDVGGTRDTFSLTIECFESTPYGGIWTWHAAADFPACSGATLGDFPFEGCDYDTTGLAKSEDLGIPNSLCVRHGSGFYDDDYEFLETPEGFGTFECPNALGNDLNGGQLEFTVIGPHVKHTMVWKYEDEMKEHHCPDTDGDGEHFDFAHSESWPFRPRFNTEIRPEPTYPNNCENCPKSGEYESGNSTEYSD